MKNALAWIGFATCVVACSGSAENGQAGATCVRLAQCAPGLACVDGMCSGDLSSLAEAGMVPVLDAGGPLDAMTLADVPVIDVDGGN